MARRTENEAEQKFSWKKFFHSAFFEATSDGTANLAYILVVFSYVLHLLIFFFFPKELSADDFLCKLVCDSRTVVIYFHEEGYKNNAIGFCFDYVQMFLILLIVIKGIYVFKKWERSDYRGVMNYYKGLIYSYRKLPGISKDDNYIALPDLPKKSDTIIILLYTIVVCLFSLLMYFSILTSDPYTGGQGGRVRFNPHNPVSMFLFDTVVIVIQFVGIIASIMSICQLFNLMIKQIFSSHTKEENFYDNSR